MPRTFIPRICCLLVITLSAVRATATHTLTVTSSAGAVAISDNTQSIAVTPFDRTYSDGVIVMFFAPSSFGGNSFSGWSGCDSTTGTACTVIMDADRTIAVSYGTQSPPQPPPSNHVITVTSTNPSSGVAIFVNPIVNGQTSGTTPFALTNFSDGTVVSLSAPPTAATNNFGSWIGCDYAVANGCLITLASDRTVTANYISGPIPQTTLFSGANVTINASLDQQTRNYADSDSRPHTYHVFASSGVATPGAFAVRLRSDSNSAGSVLTLELPSGGDPTDSGSGGGVQLLLPFGLTVNKITGVNVADASASFIGFSCQFLTELDIVRDILLNLLPGEVSAAVQRATECGAVGPLPSPSDACQVTYPIITPASAGCLDAEAPTALYGSAALNTNQVRNLQWRPGKTGTAVSDIELHLTQAPAAVISSIQQKGLTVYVHSPKADYLLDNFR